MICVPNVIILAVILKSIPWCNLVGRYSTPGFWTRDSPYLPRVDSVASSFRVLVTFAIVLKVRGIPFFQIPWTILGRSSSEPKDDNKSAPDEFSMLCCDSASSTFLHGLSGRNMSNSFDMLIHASTTQKIICSFELSLFSCLLTFIYQLIVKRMYAFVHQCFLPLWSVKPFYRRMIGETNSSTSSISRIGSKQLCSADQNASPAFDSVLLWSITPFMSGLSWELHPLSWILDVVILLTIIRHSSALVLMQPEYRQMNCDVWNQYSQQPCCLVVNG